MSKKFFHFSYQLTILLLIFTQSSLAKMPDDYNKTCSSIADPKSQKAQYCSVAQLSYKAADNNKTLMKVWGAVAAVCTSACLAGAVMGEQYPWLGVACRGGNIAAGVTTAAITKNYAIGLVGLAAGAYGLSQNNTFMSAIGMEKKELSPQERANQAAKNNITAKMAMKKACDID